MDRRYVCVATLPDVNEAQVAAARLESEGLAVRLHGEPLGPFRVTVGGMSETQVWVVSDDAEAAVAVLEEVGVPCTRWDAP